MQMVDTAIHAKSADATGPSSSDTSLRSLDGVNLFLAGALSGFGPYVAAFLAEQNWTQQEIGFVLTAGGFAGLLSQLPGGELLDTIRSKRNRRRSRCRYGGSRRIDDCTFADFSTGIGRSSAPGDHRRIPGVGDCHHQPWPGRPRSARRTTGTQSALRFDRRGARSRSHGSHRLFSIVSRNILHRRRAGVSAARRPRPNPPFRHPLWSRLERFRSPRTDRSSESTTPKTLEDPYPTYIRRLRVLVPDG